MNGVNSAVIKSYFENNTATTSAGAIGWANRPNGIIKDSKFVRNSALNEGGGAIFWNQGVNGKIINSTFENNYAVLDGGAIYFKSENGIISDSTFAQNNASLSGAAIYNKGKNATIKNSKFISNTAKTDSGIYSKNNLKITNCTDANVKIESQIIPQKGSFVINYDGTYSIIFKDGEANAISGEKITFILDGRNIGSSITDANGVATIKLTASILKTAKAGTKKLVINANSLNFTNPTKTVNVEINKEKTVLAAKAITVTYNKNKNLVITLKDGKGKAMKGLKVTVNLNGAKTYTTDKNGQVTINVAKLVPKAYAAKIAFAGNSNYLKSSAKVKVTVKKAKPKIIAKKKTYKVTAKVKKLTITLKDNKGKPIKNAKFTLKIGKKIYGATTNAIGKATFNLKKLTKKGKYIATIKYNGNKLYKQLTQKAKIIIK